eukprot:TRINITY_DN36974_c0_g1_i1.p1 TRINITY_DN36974_c0_g1~~TRINITY_DN36974_c0_g1_i1.p1  ORF type:complete len:226 (-),score=65.81 TRINITY_DN36974_c0_g1_i1:276-953(-)
MPTMAAAPAVDVSELFREYERDLQRQLQEAEAIASARRPRSEEQNCLSEAEQALRQMEMEARTLPSAQRQALDPTLRKYRADLRERRNALEERGREELLSDGATTYGRGAQDRERLTDATAELHGATAKLEAARRQALETEQIGLDVMGDLRSQREVIARAKANVAEIGTNFGQAKHIIEDMLRRSKQNRLIMFCAVGALVVLAVVGGVMVSSGGGGSSPEPAGR